MKFLSLLAAALVTPLASALTIPERRLTTPANDPFYVPPAGFESAKPGAVLRDRRIVASFFGVVPSPVDARQVLYRTTAIDGSAIATVTTIFKPLLAKRDRFIAFNTAYDSSASICNPSYGYQLGAPPLDLIAQAEFFIIQAYLLLGYTVASSDYEGPDVAFSAGRLSGMGVLDGMRAVVNYGSKIGLSANPMIVNTGYSGGAIAGGWAASLHPTYAPDLNVKGFALGGTPANLTEVLLKVDGTPFAGFLPGAIAGQAMPSAYGARLKPVLDGILTPHGREVLALGSSQCVAVNLVSFAGKSLFDPAVQTMGRGLLYQEDVAAVLAESAMGVRQAETPTAPVLLYHASADEIIPYGPVDALRQSWCAKGASVQFTTYGAGGHATTEPIGLPETIAFAEQAFSGKVARGCSTKSVLTNQLNPLALGVNLEPALSALAGIVVTLGQKDANWIKATQQGKTL